MTDKKNKKYKYSYKTNVYNRAFEKDGYAYASITFNFDPFIIRKANLEAKSHYSAHKYWKNYLTPIMNKLCEKWALVAEFTSTGLLHYHGIMYQFSVNQWHKWKYKTQLVARCGTQINPIEKRKGMKYSEVLSQATEYPVKDKKRTVEIMGKKFNKCYFSWSSKEEKTRKVKYH